MLMWILLAIVAVGLWVFARTFSSTRVSQITPSKKDFVVITGCDSGFGLSTAEKLSQQFNVIATVLNGDGNSAKNLSKLGVHVVPLNYLQEGSMEKCLEDIKHILSAKRGRLHGVVNNAGVCHFGEFDWMTPELMESMFKVNTLGPMLLIKGLMDHIFDSKSRIVNITSMAVKSNLPFFGLYTASKVAIDAFTVSLRTEMAPHGISVTAIRPGNFIGATGLLDRQKATASLMWSKMTGEARKRHEDFWEMNEMIVANQLVYGDHKTSKVVDAIENSLLWTQPADEIDVCASSLKLSFYLMNFIPYQHLYKLFVKTLNFNLWMDKQYKLYMS